MLFTDPRNHHAKDPAVVRFHGHDYMYYSTWEGELTHLSIGIARSDDLTHWEVIGDFAETQPCERNGVGAPGAIVLDGRVHLFYQTYGNGQMDAICHAVSDDGIHFVKNPDNPIYRPTADWCCGRAIDAEVCLFNGKLFLYIATRDHAYKIQKIGGAWADPASDFGRDAWTQIAAGSLLTPELTWEQECIEGPAAIVNDGQMFLFYAGAYNCKPQQIGVAVSDDGCFFRRVFTEPFLTPGAPGAWNSCESGHPCTFRDDDGQVYLFYQGSPDMGETWYLSKVKIAFDAQNRPYVEA
ncbi:MAG: family 43 glycosylhydrolase [Clostridia bacterium]|nr:family 43 glycosylhydrolase [Clostridia bacterium]